MATTRLHDIIDLEEDSNDDQPKWTSRAVQAQQVDPQLIMPHHPNAHYRPQFDADTLQDLPNALPDPWLDANFDDDLLTQDFYNVDNPVEQIPRPDAPSVTSQSYDSCLVEILEIFPDISHDFVQGLFDAHTQGPADGHAIVQSLIAQILDKGKYPKERDRQKELKRKRFADNDEEELAYLKSLERTETDSRYSWLAVGDSKAPVPTLYRSRPNVFPRLEILTGNSPVVSEMFLETSALSS